MKFYLLFIFVCFLLACGAFHKAPPYSPDQPERSPDLGSGDPSSRPTDGQAPQPPPTEWGVVKCNREQYDQFNKELKKFLSTSSNINNLHVNCLGQKDTKGGLFLRGSVKFKQNKFFDPSSNSQFLEMADNSHLEIHIVGQTHIVALKMTGTPFGGEIRGQSMTLAFQDDKGEVFLNGNVENNIFSGVLSYKNFINPVGGYPFQGSIGHFSIYACKFLTCQ